MGGSLEAKVLESNSWVFSWIAKIWTKNTFHVGAIFVIDFLDELGELSLIGLYQLSSISIFFDRQPCQVLVL